MYVATLLYYSYTEELITLVRVQNNSKTKDISREKHYFSRHIANTHTYKIKIASNNHCAYYAQVHYQETLLLPVNNT